jgi:hypothetical protein
LYKTEFHLVACINFKMSRAKVHAKAQDDLAATIKEAASKTLPYYWRLSGNEPNSLCQFLGIEEGVYGGYIPSVVVSAIKCLTHWFIAALPT